MVLEPFNQQTRTTEAEEQGHGNLAPVIATFQVGIYSEIFIFGFKFVKETIGNYAVRKLGTGQEELR